LRHPSFLGLREDKPARAIVRETPASNGQAASESQLPRGQRKFSAVSEERFERPAGKTDEGMLAGVRITSPDKVLFPDGEVTKLELAQYYLNIERWIMAQVSNRLLSLRRCPEGATGHFFFKSTLMQVHRRPFVACRSRKAVILARISLLTRSRTWFHWPRLVHWRFTSGDQRPTSSNCRTGCFLIWTPTRVCPGQECWRAPIRFDHSWLRLVS
jgi:hypothetical protein